MGKIQQFKAFREEKLPFIEQTAALSIGRIREFYQLYKFAILFQWNSFDCLNIENELHTRSYHAAEMVAPRRATKSSFQYNYIGKCNIHLAHLLCTNFTNFWNFLYLEISGGGRGQLIKSLCMKEAFKHKYRCSYFCSCWKKEGVALYCNRNTAKTAEI